MSSGFDELEELLRAEEREMYSPMVLEHGMTPRNVGRMQDADAYGKATAASCGDSMEIWLKVDDNMITDVNFWTDGCGISMATGSMITEMVRDRTVFEAQMINKDDVLDALGGLPEESEHCALLAAETLGEAIKDYLERR
ncbi:MAG: iron-sulfur cluster assembly scaffold protein [Dehalococcoidia bacterium]